MEKENPDKKLIPICENHSATPSGKMPRKCQVRFEMDKDSKMTVKVNKEDSNKNNILAQAICGISGSENTELILNIIEKGARCLYGKSEVEQYNVTLQAISDHQPTDAHEARLCVQANALYSQGMDYLFRATSILTDDDVFAKDHWNSLYMKHATRLLDLHTKTIEALARYRQQGTQTITVVHQNVNVEEGGRAAIMGNFVAENKHD